MQAEAAWEKQFRQGDMPVDIETYHADDKELADGIGLLANAFGVTKSEVRRLLEQGGVKLDGEVVDTVHDLRIKAGTIAQLGKRRFKKITV